MDTHDEKLEKKNKKIALLYTTLIQGGVFFLLFFMVAWRPPDPPLPEIGIELNFGLDDQGSGDIQPETPVGNDGAQQEQAARSKPKVKEETQKKVEEVLEKGKDSRRNQTCRR